MTADYEAGATTNELAKAWGIHRTTVIEHLKRQGVQTRRGTPKLTKAKVAEAIELYQAGASLAALGRRFNVQPETIRRKLAAAGITIQPKSQRRWT